MSNPGSIERAQNQHLSPERRHERRNKVRTPNRPEMRSVITCYHGISSSFLFCLINHLAQLNRRQKPQHVHRLAYMLDRSACGQIRAIIAETDGPAHGKQTNRRELCSAGGGFPTGAARDLASSFISPSETTNERRYVLFKHCARLILLCIASNLPKCIPRSRSIMLPVRRIPITRFWELSLGGGAS